MSIRFLIINIILSICSCLKFCPKTSNMNYLYLRDITYLYSSTLKFSNHRTIWASKMFEGWLNLETELITCYLTFDSCHGPLTVSPLVSFLCLKIITRQHVHEVISHHHPQVYSPAHLSQALSLLDILLCWIWLTEVAGSEPDQQKWGFILSLISSAVPIPGS